MADIRDWANTAEGNNQGSPPDFPIENQPASTVNDCARENMAAVRRWYEDGGWSDWGHQYSYVSGDTFQVAGDQSAVYVVGRRVRIQQLSGTITGTITAVSVSANTDVTVETDDDAVIPNEAMAVSVGTEPVATSAPPAALTGEVKIWAGSSIPTGWLPCNGGEYPVATFPDLHAVIGDTFGGDGGTNFNVPDLQGRVPVGAGAGSGLTTRTLGDSGGEEAHQLTVSELPAHSHSLNNATNLISRTSAAGRDSPSGNDAREVNITVNNTGGDEAHNNMQPFLALSYIIKT